MKKKIPVVWRGLWKKELASKGIISCRQVGCTYTCSSYKNICEHYYQCNFIPQEVTYFIAIFEKTIRYINENISFF
jgi:hypothetical protein